MICTCGHVMALHRVHQDMIEVYSANDPPGVSHWVNGLRWCEECRRCDCVHFVPLDRFETVGDLSLMGSVL